MKSLYAILILVGVIWLRVSGEYQQWLRHDEDTIRKTYGTSILETRQIEMINLINKQLEENEVGDNAKSRKVGVGWRQKEREEDESREDADQDESKYSESKTTDSGNNEASKSKSGDTFCGLKLCEGSNAYCCHLIDGDIGCCWSTQLYDLWWFWVIWVILFFLILACSLACWRRRRAQYRYTVMANSEYPGYGTVVHTSSTTSTQSGSIPPQYAPPPGAQYGPPPGAQYGPPSGQQYGAPQGQQYMPATTQQYVPPTAPTGPPGYPGSEKPPAYSR